jgi:anaerobic selenocysteine-containing dehydrogenase
VNPKTAATQGIEDGDWVWVESPWGRVRGMCRYSEATEPGTVWTWNAIGKQPGAWNLEPSANEARKGFLLNHLITEELPPLPDGEHLSNSDPVTGQAGWYDVRVRLAKAGPAEEHVTWPQFLTLPTVPGEAPRRKNWLAYVAGKIMGA